MDIPAHGWERVSMNVAVIGANGQLGSDMVLRFSAAGDRV